MTEEMRNISRVKGEERQPFRHIVQEEQAYDTVLVPSAPTQRTVSTSRARVEARVCHCQDAEAILSFFVVRALFRAPLVVVSRQRELVVNRKWLRWPVRSD
jgi:hypothetical protein